MFEGIRPDPSWAFAELTQKHTNYATHGYHRYPAKFIPQLVARLIQEYSSEGGLVVDPFMGSGTTLVEAKLLRRPSVGVDINPVARLIAQAKTQAIEPGLLTRAVAQLREAIPDPAQPTLFRDTPNLPVSSAAWHERLRYWFAESTLQQLNQIQCAIEALDSDALRTFFRCALSHTLKTVSYWHDRSVKPIRKLSKPIPDAREAFFRQVQRMLRGNYEFWQLLCERNALETPATPYCADARALPVETESAQLVTTSPPYVTSYEYADLHQLSALWFRWTTNLRAFRAGFIGRSNGLYTETDDLHSRLAERIVERIGEVSVRKAREVALYFAEMWGCFKEVHRVLRRGGYTCIVIGNTHLCEVEVQNAQVFAEQLQALGFGIERVILREIPSKILPQTRDKTTGKFARTQDADYTAYPTEYILIAQRR
ncbi:MAG: site-specific DNA-methyltransferase [Fimbriimonadales bacterium]|nr:site-specific DNA-methyltransferase [Fimbriimonadales bacterium]